MHRAARPPLLFFLARCTRNQLIRNIEFLKTETRFCGSDFSGINVDMVTRDEVHHKAIEVLRRQTDGARKLILGDPNGRG